MACDICGRGACTESFHSLDEQEAYAEVIAAFDRARELRRELRDRLAEEAQTKTEDEDSDE